MLEKFSPQEIEQIKKELGVSDKTAGSKSSLLSEQKSRLGKIMKNNKHRRAGYEVWEALLVICDFTLENLQRKPGTEDVKDRDDVRILYRRYASIFHIEPYRHMMDDLLKVIEDYRDDKEKSENV